MFNKKKIININIEDEVEVATSNSIVIEVKEELVEVKEVKEELQEVEVIQDINIVKNIVEEIEEIEVIQDINIVKNTVEETEEFIVGNFTFSDSDPNNECSVDEDESDEVIEIETEEEIDKKNRKDLSSYFEASKKNNSKIKIKEKRKSKRQRIKEEELLGIKNQKIFVFRNKKYTEVEDFIEYLNNHYQEIDKISKEVLDDEKFYTWLSKNSDVFDDSIKQFRDIKEKIEKK